MDKRLERILPRVQKPARYVGGEYNAILKNKDEVDTRIAFCFPDTYEIGMSNLGMRILYGVMNDLPGPIPRDSKRSLRNRAALKKRRCRQHFGHDTVSQQITSMCELVKSNSWAFTLVRPS